MTKINVVTFGYPEDFQITFDKFLHIIERDESIQEAITTKNEKRGRKGTISIAIRLLIESYVDANQASLEENNGTSN